MLGKHSGRHALQSALMDLGYQVSGQTLNQAFKRFKEIADKKKQVTAMDLEALVTDELRADAARLHAGVVRRRGLHAPPAARHGLHPHARRGRASAATSPATARSTPIFRAINAATSREARLREFRIDAVTAGQDALGEASVVLELAGQYASGQGVSTDIIEAAALAYMRALSNVERQGARSRPSRPRARSRSSPRRPRGAAAERSTPSLVQYTRSPRRWSAAIFGPSSRTTPSATTRRVPLT